MERKMFGFKPAPLTTVEFAYKIDLTPDCMYFQLTREGYPCNIYAKQKIDGSISEIYPLYIKSMKNSLEIITNNLPYTETFDFRHYAYMSWDLKTEPKEIYLTLHNDTIEKYKENRLDAIYYTVYDLNLLKYNPLISHKIYDFVKSEKPDVFMYVVKDGEIKRFCNIFNFSNKKYSEKHKQISSLQDLWV